ncbi:uncharacterized protein PV06_06275 [Exophiala oligosperma]|uniref:Uncharacterized protein n=1 Tax=Exophiala oligosperma TaxID=215243 RepID=A0A0D2AS81_9EURO|nr:uncharacterized protein PV06_06275 [Exophiala oligosperma]KIW42761.1 hypothetical protein PV06_06275 [Exophiala oligosperma]
MSIKDARGSGHHHHYHGPCSTFAFDKWLNENRKQQPWNVLREIEDERLESLESTTPKHAKDPKTRCSTDFGYGISETVSWAAETKKHQKNRSRCMDAPNSHDGQRLDHYQVSPDRVKASAEDLKNIGYMLEKPTRKRENATR